MKNFIRKKIYNISQGKRYHDPLVEPDEIFLDSKNLPDFDVQQFEGQIELPISRSSFFGIGLVLLVVVLLFSSRLWFLQIAKGATYQKQSEYNSLSREPIFASRGNIYDRNNVPLAWNDTKTDTIPWGLRSYISSAGFAHILGYVGYPQKDSSGNYWQADVIGKDGVEKYYDGELHGTNGSNIVEKNISGVVQSGNIVNQPVAGKNITLTIDSRLQATMYSLIAGAVKNAGFKSASAVVLDIHTGEVLVMTNFPEYSPAVMSLGKDSKTIKGYLSNSNSPLLNRAISGLVTPGSIVKPYVAMGALNENVIDPLTKILSAGSISVLNPFFPDKPSIFSDYGAFDGWVDMRHALSISSNIYFYEVGGGYKNQKGIGITNIGKYLSMFGLTDPTGVDLLGEKSGNVPSPDWKAKKFPGEPWRIGDTYNTAIGQYGVVVTPIEMARAVSAIANRGTLVTPHVAKTDIPDVTKKIDLPDSFYTIIQEGMRLGATEGTGKILARLSFKAASKSGTAQVGPGGIHVNSWMTGFFPYDNPRYSFALVLQDGPRSGLGSSQGVMYRFLDWLAVAAPEYIK